MGENHPVKKDPEWEFVGYRGGHLTYMRKKDPRYQKFKARKTFRWLLKMNAVLLGCCFLLDYVRRKQIEENKKRRAGGADGHSCPREETAPGDDSRVYMWDSS